ncbi:MAG: hypothetical protein QM496_19820 [Verrucomicrobiota bacterium]
MIKEVNKAFADIVSANSYFSDWSPKGTRVFTNEQDKVRREIDLQVDKYWEKTGGAVAVNLSCAHKLDVPPLGWTEGGFDNTFIRLAPLQKSDYWWKINSEESIEAFKEEFEQLLCEIAVPWFDSAKTINGILSLEVWTKGKLALFPYQLQSLGKVKFQSEFFKWIKTLPRQEDNVFKWAVEAGVIDANDCNQLIEASRQMKTRYEDRVSNILAGIKPSL